MKSGVGDTLAKAFLGGYNEKREPTFVGSLGVILFYVLVGMKGFEPSTP